METMSAISTDCLPPLQCLSGFIPDECKAAGVACATTAMSSQQNAASPMNHVSPASTNTPASTGSRAVMTASSDSEESVISSSRPSQPTSRPLRPHRRIPHTIIERRYRDNLNTQIETLRLSLPSLKNAYVTSPDVEDSALPPRLPSKAMIIATASAYIRELEGERDTAEQAVATLQRQVDDLQKLVQCNDCSILQYLQAVGGGGQAVAA